MASFGITAGSRTFLLPIPPVRIIPWRRVTETFTSTTASAHVSWTHPVWFCVAGRRGTSTYSLRHSTTAPSTWARNGARLYARHVLAAAAVAAATARRRTRLEQLVVVEPPSDWLRWEKKSWADELLASLGRNKLERFGSATRRIASLLVLAAPLTLLVPLSCVSERATAWSWAYALWSIEQAGPTYIKLVQWATTRQDLFSPEFCQYFGKLRDETTGHAWQATVDTLLEDLGIGADFLQLETKPIGSGCIAQVYKGKLTQPSGPYPVGTDIAVKVQHPGIWDKVCVDFYILGKAAAWLERIPYLNLSYLSLADSVRQFRDIMLPQLDLTLEANHLQRFNRDFRDDDRVAFPEPLKELTTTRVLTETFCHGTPILEYTKAPPKVREELAYLGLSTTLKMIFLHDFLHGDLHPGNILVSNTPKGDIKLNLLDCGLVVEMGPEQHINLVKILGAFTRRDGRLAGQLMVDTSSHCQASPLDVELFVNGIERIILDDAKNNFVENVGDYITDICYMACVRKVKLEASFINAALAIEIIEGIAQQLHPQIVVTKEALPLIVKAEMMHRLPKFSLW
jgi:aarF domain-containing kinase